MRVGGDRKYQQVKSKGQKFVEIKLRPKLQRRKRVHYNPYEHCPELVICMYIEPYKHINVYSDDDGEEDELLSSKKNIYRYPSSSHPYPPLMVPSTQPPPLSHPSSNLAVKKMGFLSNQANKEQLKLLYLSDNLTYSVGSSSNMSDIYQSPETGFKKSLFQLDARSKQASFEKKEIFPKKTFTGDIKAIVSQQHFEGYWENISIIAFLFGQLLAKAIEGQEDETAVITFLILHWIEKNHPSAAYILIRRKAESWLKRQPKSSAYQLLYGKQVL